MPDFLHLKPEEVDTVEKRGKYKISIVGCGPRGIYSVIKCAKAGYKVVGTDADQSVVKRLLKGKMSTPDRDMECELKSFLRKGMLTFTSDLNFAVVQSDVIVLTVAAKIDPKKSASYSEIENSSKQIGTALKKGKLVIYGGIASLGLMEEVIEETLENSSGLKAGEDFGLVYNPILISDGEGVPESLCNTELIIGANDENSAESAEIVLNSLTGKRVKQVLDFKTAELAVLFIVARQDLNMALSNELAMLCQNAGNDYLKTLIADIGSHGFGMAPTVADGRWRDEIYLLLESAENLNAKLKLTTIGRQINEGMTKYTVNLVQDTLHSCGKTLRRARITLLGKKRPTTSEDDFIRLLEAKGAKVCLFHPFLFGSALSNIKTATGRTLIEASEGSDCILILADNPQLNNLNLKNLRTVMRAPAAIIDLARVISPDDVVKEGFIYRGLGRGSEKK